MRNELGDPDASRVFVITGATRRASRTTSPSTLGSNTGVLAPNAKLRKRVVGYARPQPLPEAPATETQTRTEKGAGLS